MEAASVSAEMARQFQYAQFHERDRVDDTLRWRTEAMEIGTTCHLEQLREAMEDWFRRKSYLTKDRAAH